MLTFGYLFIMFIFPIMAFKTIMGMLSLFSLRKKIYHEIVLKQLHMATVSAATGEANQTSPQIKNSSFLDFSQLSKEQIKILEQFVPKSKSLAFSKAIKKTIKTSAKFALVAFGIMSVFFLTLYLINFFMITYL